MSTRHLWYALPVLLVLGCAEPPPPLPPLPPSIHTIAVLPPNNQTGDSLVVSGSSLLEKYILHSERVTVPDVLAAEARWQLERHGFSVVAPEVVDVASEGHAPTSVQDAAAMASHGSLQGAAALYIDLRRWEPDISFQPRSVIVWVEVTLIDPSTGKVLWSAEQEPRPVETPGAVNLGDAYIIAARTVMQTLLGPVQPEQPPS